MSVMSGAFPDTNGVFYVTISSWRSRGPSRHRHGERQRRNALPKRLTRRRDGDDAHDDELRVRSRQGPSLLRRPLPFQPDPTNPTHRARSPLPMRSLRPLAASGLSSLPDNPTLLPDEKDGLSSGW
jgi:hypothetical protein